MHRSFALLLMLVVCSVGAGTLPAVAESEHAHWRTFTGMGVSFKYPPGWRSYNYAWSSTFSTLITYISNVPLHDPCARTPDSISCGRPLRALPPRGVLVTWTENGAPGWTFRSVKGQVFTAGGRPAKLRAIHRAALGCPGGTKETIDLIVSRAEADNWYEMVACLHGPLMYTFTTEIMTMIRSLRVAAQGRLMSINPEPSIGLSVPAALKLCPGPKPAVRRVIPAVVHGYYVPHVEHSGTAGSESFGALFSRRLSRDTASVLPWPPHGSLGAGWALLVRAIPGVASPNFHWLVVRGLLNCGNLSGHRPTIRIEAARLWSRRQKSHR